MRSYRWWCNLIDTVGTVTVSLSCVALCVILFYERRDSAELRRENERLTHEVLDAKRAIDEMCRAVDDQGERLPPQRVAP